MYNTYNFDLLIWEFEKKISLQCLSYVYLVKILIPQQNNSQGGRGHFTYLLERQIHFALKLSVTCLI